MSDFTFPRSDLLVPKRPAVNAFNLLTGLIVLLAAMAAGMLAWGFLFAS